MVIDRSIFRCRRILDLSVDSGYSREPTGHLQFLPRKYLSGYRGLKWLQHLEFTSCFPTPILPTKLRSVGKCTLVLELGHQPHLCSTCDATATMGTKISQDHTATIQSSQASADPYVLFRRRREVPPSMGSRSLTHTSTHFPVPVLRRPRRVPMQR
jgi:hypothetical protein